MSRAQPVQGILGRRRPLRQVKLATTAAITLATGLEAGDTIDGVVLVLGDEVLVKDQASAVENGVYIVQTSGAPIRADWADSTSEMHGLSVLVTSGTANADRAFVQVTDNPTIASSNIVFQTIDANSLGGASVAGRVVITHGTTGQPTTDADLLYNATTNILTVPGITIPINNGPTAADIANGFTSVTTSGIDVIVSGFVGHCFRSGSFAQNSSSAYSWTNGSSPGGTQDLLLYRGAAATMEQRNATSAQMFRVYNTYTDGSNYERGYCGWISNRYSFVATAGGSGGSRGVDLGTDSGSSGSTRILTAGQVVMSFLGTSMQFTPYAQSTYGTTGIFTFTPPNHTNMTVSTEIIAAHFATSTKQWAQGAISLQREWVFAAPTYAFATGAATIANAATAAITGPPIVGTNATFTDAYGLTIGTPQAVVTAGRHTLGLFHTSADAGEFILRETTNSVEFFAQTHSTGVYMGNKTAHALNIRTNNITRLQLAGDGSVLVFSAALNMEFNATTGTKLGTATSQKLGLWNATPVVQPTAVADATDAATAITQLNALLARMRTVGMIAA